MWRMRRLSSALLSFGLSMATAVALTPVAGATPGYDAGPTPSSGPPQPSSTPPLSWGSCGQVLSNAPATFRPRNAGPSPVPVDYANPGGAQVQLAVIRIPATGPRIGSLLVNPGGPGASAVDMVAAHGRRSWPAPRSVGDSIWSASTPAASATPRRRCAARPTPSSTLTGANRWSTTARRVWRTSSRCTGRWLSAVWPGMVRRSWRTSGPRRPHATWMSVRQALGDDQINYLGYSYGTELGTAYVERFGDHVRSMVLDGAIDPSVGPIDELINQEAGFQTAFNDYAADCARSHGLPAGHRPGPVGQPLPPIDRPAGDQTRGDLGAARARLRRRDHRHHQRAVHPAVLEIPHQRPARSAARHRSR